MNRFFIPLLLLATALHGDTPRRLDGFEDPARWTVLPSDGIKATASAAPGFEGQALRLDFDFQGRGGYAVVRRELPLDLPDNYEFRFRIRGEGLPNNLEFKLVDPSGDNVWWMNRRDFEPPREWTELRIKKRHISFAWGPAGGGDMRKVAALEITVTAGKGGRGYVLLDDLTFSELPPDRPYDRMPKLSSSSTWRAMDFLQSREYGGLIIDWEPNRFASRYDVQISDDGQTWRTVRTVQDGNGGRDYLFLPETESRHLRLLFHKGSGDPKIEVQPLSFAASRNDFFQTIAKDAPRGRYPRPFAGEQPYWTVIGVDGDTAEAMLNEDGLLETGKSAFSIEPFLHVDGKLVTWADVKSTQSLADGDLPIPSVTWERGPLNLRITAFAAGEPERSVLYARYRVSHRGPAEARLRLVLAVRPFQVNPPWQFLNTPGGVATVQEIAWDGRVVNVDGRTVRPLEPPTAFGASTFDEGDVTERLAHGELPERTQISDPFGHASAAMAWDLRVPPGQSRDIHLAIPMHASGDINADFDAQLAAVEREWREKLDRVEIRLPAAFDTWSRTLRSNVAYILINRDGPGIQPGSRSYERSWIRDGALTSTALLRLGHAEAAREFLVWFAGHQFDDGKVPCCVDARGADPVPEHDSHGELLHLITEYVRYTGDRATAAALWPNVQGAVAYIDKIRNQRRTEEYRTPEKLPYFGLLPESISHEGYSDRAVHSYWDGFWGLRGLNDAVELARLLGKNEEAGRWATIRDEFRTDLHASIRRTIALHKIDYIPGSVEKGDFDATSTSIGVAPGGELARLPEKELRHTFERYWQEILARKDGTKDWDAYTPYELRNARTMLRLGWPERARELIALQMEDRRPAAWNHWAEVVARKPREGRFLGDMPHTWVGSEFIHSFLDLFAYTREEDQALILAAGVPADWLESGEGIAVRGLRTPWGILDYSMRPQGDRVVVRIGGGVRIPPGGVRVHWPGGDDGDITVRELPAEIVLQRH